MTTGPCCSLSGAGAGCRFAFFLAVGRLGRPNSRKVGVLFTWKLSLAFATRPRSTLTTWALTPYSSATSLTIPSMILQLRQPTCMNSIRTGLPSARRGFNWSRLLRSIGLTRFRPNI